MTQVGERDGWHAVVAAIETRRSIRGFLPTPVARVDVERLLALASRAPSGSNIQPWKVHVVSGTALQALTDALAGEPETREYEYHPVNWRLP